MISLTFNETVILNEDWTEEKWRMEVSGPMSPYPLNWTFLSENILKVPTENLTVWFSYEIAGKQRFGNGSEVLTIYFDDLEVMNSYSYNFPMINSTVKFNLYPLESDEDCSIGWYGIAIMGIALTMACFGFVGLLVRHSMVIAWQVIGLLQFMNFVPLMMIYTPSCIVRMCQSFSIFNTELGAIGAAFIRTIFSKDDFKNSMDYKFLRSGYTSTSFLWNAADVLMLWMICILLIPIFWLIKYIFSQYEILHTIEARFKRAFAYILIMLTYLRVSF